MSGVAPPTASTASCTALAALLLQRGWMLSTAESCTGGLVAAACTELAGSSAWFERGFVSYSNAAKTELLGVPAALIQAQGAVSEAVARAMALGALQHSATQVALAVTGIAGPSGAVPGKPVGTVWFGWAWPSSGTAAGAPTPTVHTELQHFAGDRTAVRAAACAHALQRLLALLQEPTA